MTWGLPEKRKDLLERKPLQGRQSQGQLPGPKTEAQEEGRNFESLILRLRFTFFFFFLDEFAQNKGVFLVFSYSSPC